MTANDDFAKTLKQAGAAQDWEEKIKLLETALELEPNLSEWEFRNSRERVRAAIYSELGYAYQRRIEGDQADNTDRAIAALEAALKLFDPNDPPKSRGDAHHNLATAYTRRIHGDAAGNFDQAVAHIEAALQIFTRENTPLEWARAQVTLGIAYDRRIEGDKTDNVERAIAAYKAALSVLTRENAPIDWAGTQKNLAISYAKCFAGYIVGNLHRAIAAYDAALTVFTQSDFPEEWRKIHESIATVLSNITTIYSADDFYSGLTIAASPELRRRFLKEFVAKAPDYSQDRLARHRAPYEDMLLETEAARQKGFPETHPQQWLAWLQRLEAAREFIEANIKEDREKNSATPAKRVLEESLNAGTPFVLILRSYSLETRELTEIEIKDYPAAFSGYRGEAVRGPWSKRAIDELAAIIKPHHKMLTFANKNDYWPPEDIPKFYVTYTDWRKVALPLIAQATAIVILLPLALDRIVRGVMQELEAIKRLQASAKTIAVIETDEKPCEPEREFEAVRAELEKREIKKVFKAEDMIAAPQSLLDELNAVLSAKLS
jgi:tetratricopeptide (TPR) repeat protein